MTAAGARRCSIVVSSVLVAGAVVAAPLGASAVAATRVPAGAVRGGSSSSPSHRTASAASSLSLPTTGRLHLLRSAARVVDSASGRGLPRGTVRARSHRSVRVLGVSRIPTTRVRAVAVVVTVTKSRGLTQVWLGPGSTPVVSAGKGSTSAFAIVPTPTRKLALRMGARAANVSVSVIGWFSAAAESSHAGLFRAAGGGQLASLVLKPHEARTVRLVGAQGIPKAGVGAILASVSATSTAAGSLAVGPAGTRLSVAGSQTFRAHGDADLALLRIGSNGSVRLRNDGSRTVTVGVESRGWFSDGTDSQAFGDTLSVAAPRLVLSSRTLGPGGAVATVCAAGGVPAATVARPATFVVGRALGTASRTTSITVDPDATTPSHLTQATLRPGRASSFLVLAAPDAACRSRAATTAGSARLSWETLAWFSGSLVLSPHLRLLSRAVTSTITAVSSTDVTFHASASALPAFGVGDVLSAGRTATTPRGLLRRITAVTRAGTDLHVTTADAEVSDAVLQGAVSVRGAAARAYASRPVVKAAVRPAAGRRGALPPSGTDCGLHGVGTGIGVSVGCSITANEGTGWAASVGAGVGVGIDVDAEIHVGSSYVRAVVGVSDAIQLGLQSELSGGASAEVSYSKDIQLTQIPPGEVLVGPVPVVWEIGITDGFSVSGSITGPFTATAFLTAAALTGIDTRTGPVLAQNRTAGGTFSSTDSGGSVGLTVNPDQLSLSLRLEGLLTMSVGVGPTVGVTFDGCRATVTVGVGATASVSIGRFGVSLGLSLPGVSISLTAAAIDIINCAIWSGTMTLERSLHNVTTEGKPALDLHFSEVLTFGPTTNRHPPDDSYPTSGSGSGASIGYSYVTCPPSPDLVTKTTKENWSGDVTGTPNVGVIQQGQLVTVNYTGQFARFPDGTRASQTCDGTDTVTYEKFSDFFMLGVEGAPPDDPLSWSGVIIHIPIGAGQMSVTGTRHASSPGAGGTDDQTFTYSLTKRCTKGGTSC